MAQRQTRSKTIDASVVEAGNIAFAVTGRFDNGYIGQNVGNGTRYVDGRDSGLVFYGVKGARQAVAYYLGVVAGWYANQNSDGTGRIHPDVHAAMRPLYDFVKWADRVDPNNVHYRTGKNPDEWYAIGHADVKDFRQGEYASGGSPDLVKLCGECGGQISVRSGAGIASPSRIRWAWVPSHGSWTLSPLHPDCFTEPTSPARMGTDNRTDGTE